MKIISSASSLATIWCISFLPILAHAQEVHDGLHHLSDHFATTGHLPTSPDEHLEYILTDKNLTVVWQSHQGQLSTRRRKADKKWNKNNDKKKKKKKKKKEKKEKIKQQINSGSREITKTLRPTDDAFITRSNRNKNYNLNQLRFSDSLPLTRSFIKFQIGNTAKNAKQVQSATLRLYALSELQSQVTIHTVGGNWDEKKVTWKNAPRTIGPKKTIQYLVPKKRAEGNKGKMWYNVDVTEAVKWNLEQGRKVVTFRLSATYSARRNKDSNKERIGLLAAKEYNNGAYSPRLVLKVNKSASSSSNNKPNNIKPNKPQASNPNPQPRPKPIPIAPKPKPKPPSGSNSSAIAELTISTLASKEEEINNKLFLYLNAITGANEPSTIYKYIGLEKGLKVMSEKGVNGHYFYLGSGLNINQASKYGLVNVAAFLAQSMKETIKYNACDENNWDLVDGKYYAISNACGQLGQSYQDYHCPPDEKHMECPVDKNMEITAVTHATWYGAPGPLYCGPKKNPKDFTGFWDYMYECNNPWATPPETCDVYPNQKAGRYDNTVKIANVAGRTDVEGCCWWGRGVIQTTGVCNFGKLNYHLGKRAASEGREAAYPDVDFCKNPEVICSSPKYAELKWIAGLFYWMESVQSYNVRGWNYLKRLHAFVDGGYSDPSFIDSVSGIVNRGCHDPPCGTGDVDGLEERAGNFESALSVFGLL